MSRVVAVGVMIYAFMAAVTAGAVQWKIGRNPEMDEDELIRRAVEESFQDQFQPRGMNADQSLVNWKSRQGGSFTRGSR